MAIPTYTLPPLDTIDEQIDFGEDAVVRKTSCCMNCNELFDDIAYADLCHHCRTLDLVECQCCTGWFWRLTMRRGMCMTCLSLYDPIKLCVGGCNRRMRMHLLDATNRCKDCAP